MDKQEEILKTKVKMKMVLVIALISITTFMIVFGIYIIDMFSDYGMKEYCKSDLLEDEPLILAKDYNEACENLITPMDYLYGACFPIIIIFGISAFYAMYLDSNLEECKKQNNGKGKEWKPKKK